MYRVKEWIAALVGFGVLVLSMRSAFKSDGKEELKHEQLKDSVKRVDRGREAVEDGRASGLSNAERLRRNRARWD